MIVTGGAGYIGSVVAKQLLAAGHDVVVLDDLSRGHAAAMPAGAATRASRSRSRTALARAAGRHRRGAPLRRALARRRVRRAPGALLAQQRRRHAATCSTRCARTASTRLVFSSTAATYGEPETVPIVEDEPTAPVNAYGASKLAVDLMLRDECVAHGLAATSLRYFNVAGASGEQGEDHEPETHLIPLVLQAAAGTREHINVFGTDYPTRDGTAVRDYIHVEDLGEAHLLALEALRPGAHRVFNLGTGDGYTVREVIEAARRVTGREITARRRAAAPATRRSSWPPTRGRAPSSAGRRVAGSRR